MTQTVEQVTAGADWLLCAGCQRPIYGKRFICNLRVCPEGGLHQPLTAEQRLAQLADGGRYEPLQLAVSNTDPPQLRRHRPLHHPPHPGAGKDGVGRDRVVCQSDHRGQPGYFRGDGF